MSAYFALRVGSHRCHFVMTSVVTVANEWRPPCLSNVVIEWKLLEHGEYFVKTPIIVIITITAAS